MGKICLMLDGLAGACEIWRAACSCVPLKVRMHSYRQRSQSWSRYSTPRRLPAPPPAEHQPEISRGLHGKERGKCVAVRNLEAETAGLQAFDQAAHAPLQAEGAEKTIRFRIVLARPESVTGKPAEVSEYDQHAEARKHPVGVPQQSAGR